MSEEIINTESKIEPTRTTRDGYLAARNARENSSRFQRLCSESRLWTLNNVPTQNKEVKEPIMEGGPHDNS